MRLGLTMGYSGAELALDVAMAQEAEALGYHSVWTAEAYGSDARQGSQTRHTRRA